MWLPLPAVLAALFLALFVLAAALAIVVPRTGPTARLAWHRWRGRKRKCRGEGCGTRTNGRNPDGRPFCAACTLGPSLRGVRGLLP